MKSFGEQLNEEQRELLVELYIAGLDENNEEKIATVLRFALRDELLDTKIDEINSFYRQEIGLDNLTNVVVNLADKHLKTRYEEEELEIKPLTFGEVAKQMEAKNRVPKTDFGTFVEVIRTNIPLPSYLTLSEIKRLANQL